MDPCGDPELKQGVLLQVKYFNLNVKLRYTISIIQFFENPSRLPLTCSISSPVAGVILPLFVPNDRAASLHQVAFYTSSINSVVPLSPRIQSDKLTTTFQFVHKLG